MGCTSQKLLITTSMHIHAMVLYPLMPRVIHDEW